MSRRKKQKRAPKRYKRQQKARGMNTMSTTTDDLFVKDRTLTKLKIVAKVQFDGMTFADAFFAFRGNDVNFPFVELAPFFNILAQPIGMDQYAMLYNRYTVIGSKCTAEFVPSGTSVSTEQSIVELGIMPVSAINRPVVESLYPYEYAQYNYGQTTNTTSLQPNKAQNRLTGYISTAKVYGAPKSAVTIDKVYSGHVNPADVPPDLLWYWNVGIAVPDAVTLDHDIEGWLYVELTYYCQFHDRYMPIDLFDRRLRMDWLGYGTQEECWERGGVKALRYEHRKPAKHELLEDEEASTAEARMFLIDITRRPKLGRKQRFDKSVNLLSNRGKIELINGVLVKHPQ